MQPRFVTSGSSVHLLLKSIWTLQQLEIMATRDKKFHIENLSSLKVVRANGRSNQTTLTNWDDMTACGMPYNTVQDAYIDEFGKKPDQVHINDDFCKDYGWLSYNLLGDTTYYNVSVTPKADTEGERFLENTTDEPYITEVVISTTMSNSATTTVTNSSSISVGSSITVGAPDLGIGAEFSQEFTFSNEVGSSSTQSIKVMISDKVIVTVPPGARYRVYLQVRWESRTEEWEIPVEIDRKGLTGAQFPSTVDGHYHWSRKHDSYFTAPFKSKIRGKLDCAYNSTGNIVVEDAPLREEN